MSTTNITTRSNATIITAKIRIHASRQEVWKALSLPGEIQKFHPLIKSSCMLSAQQSGLGAIRQCDLLPMGQMVERIDHWNEGKGFVTEVIDGKFLPPYLFMRGKIDLKEETPNCTYATFEFSYRLKFGALGNLMNKLFILPQFKKAPGKYVSGLKSYLEGPLS